MAGVDTIEFAARRKRRDLPAAVKPTNIERIDLMPGGQDHSLNHLTLQDVLDMTGGDKTLTILGDSGDSVGLKNGVASDDQWVKRPGDGDGRNARLRRLYQRPRHGGEDPDRPADHPASHRFLTRPGQPRSQAGSSAPGLLANRRAGGAIEAEGFERPQFGVAGDAFGQHLQTYAMRDATQAFEEGGVAGIGIQAAHKARIDFQEIEPEIVPLPDLAEFIAKVFETDAAARSA